MPGTCTSIINLRYQDGSEGSPSNPAKFKNQDYEQLKVNSLRRGKLFVDSSFPPDLSSLGNLESLSSWQEREVKWLRPADILTAQNRTEQPVFLHEGASRYDFCQGDLGNCWFLAAISALTFHKKLLAQVVPLEQNFDNYAGIFHFRFWRFGKWVDVVIDDLLPTRNNQLLLVNCKGSNEFWVPLLEKAYAKVCGSYADMNAGLPSEACKDFSGGVSMMYELSGAHTSSHDEELWRSLSNATGCNSMICCGTAPKGGSLVNTISHTGLVDAHAYSVTGVTEVTYYGTKEKLVRVMNPWGETEWNGKWSDSSDLWQRVSPEDREKCHNRDDGEFWMPLEDFCHYFSMLFICCENPNFIDGDLSCQWKCMSYNDSWVAGTNAGGNVNSSTFATNPQYRIQVTIINKEERNDQNILLSLMQVPQQANRKKERSYPIALTIFKVPPGTPAGRLSSSFFRRQRPIKDQQSYTHERELVEMHSLEPGEYVIVPSTMDAYTNADFVLSVYTKTDAKISPHIEDGDDHDHGHDEENLIPTKPAEKDSVSDLFNRYADQNGELNYRQLQKLLNDNFPHGSWNGFDTETCRSMIAMVDKDQRMTMSFTEFSALWKKIEEYKSLFHRSDTNKNGALSDDEIQNAIKAAGMNMNDFMVQRMIFRYSDFGSTTLENFISLMVRLDKSSSVFNNKSTDGVITLKWDEWTTIFMYN